MEFSKEMRSLESMDWLVLADLNEEIIGASGVGGIIQCGDLHPIKEKIYQGKGVGANPKLVQASAVERRSQKKRLFITLLELVDINNKQSLKLPIMD